MNEFLKINFLNNSLQSWIIALAILLVSWISIRILKLIVLRWLKKWSSNTENTLDDFLVARVEKSLVPLLYILSIYFAVITLTIATFLGRIIHMAILFVVSFYVMGLITAFIRQFVFSFLKTQENSETKEKQAKGLLIIVNIIVWVLGVVFVINNLGYNVTTLITGLGIGGIAIALAAQTILGDLFSYFVIFFDRPFEIGDLIVVQDKTGTVEYVGIKTTRLRMLNGEQLICSNSFLTNAQVHNYKRMQERRNCFHLSVGYKTTQKHVEEIPNLVKTIIQSTEQVRFDRAHFSGFGSASLDFEFVYYVESADYRIYMDKQQEIYLAILKIFEMEKIDLYYSNQTLQVNLPESAVGLKDRP